MRVKEITNRTVIMRRIAVCHLNVQAHCYYPRIMTHVKRFSYDKQKNKLQSSSLVRMLEYEAKVLCVQITYNLGFNNLLEKKTNIDKSHERKVFRQAMT